MVGNCAYTCDSTYVGKVYIYYYMPATALASYDSYDVIAFGSNAPPPYWGVGDGA